MKKNIKTLGPSNHCIEEREVNDFYATPPDAVYQLLKLEKFNKNILEPCCGDGSISNVLLDNNFNVISSDLIDYKFGEVKSLFEIEKWNGDIITNPPYTNSLDYVKHCLHIINKGSKLAMFLKLLFLESISRKEFLINNPPKQIWVSSSRYNCVKNGIFNKNNKSTGGAICFSWFIWEKGFKGDTKINLFN